MYDRGISMTILYSNDTTVDFMPIYHSPHNYKIWLLDYVDRTTFDSKINYAVYISGCYSYVILTLKKVAYRHSTTTMIDRLKRSFGRLVCTRW